MGDIIQPILSNPTFVLTRNLCVLFFVVVDVALVFWTYRDAQRRGALGWLWAVATLLFSFAGWVVYLMVRPPELLDDVRERNLEIRTKEVSLAQDYEACPHCYTPVEKDFLICPNCLKKLRNECVNCGRALKLKWNVCPYCRTQQPQDSSFVSQSTPTE